MKAILIISIILLTYSGTAYSYPESQMNDCVASALSNPATKSISKIAITNYCDCALRANIDDKVSVKIPAQKCHLFNKKTGERIRG